MKGCVITLLLILGCGLASKPVQLKFSKPHIQKTTNKDLCPTCVNFLFEFTEALGELILNGGVVGTCTKLCTEFGNKVNSKTAAAVCGVLCGVVGFDEFVKLFQDADLDPIYYCEAIFKLCPIKDDGDAKITKFVVDPATIEYGNQFFVNMTFTTVNGTGTGQLVLDILTQDLVPVDDVELIESLDPGSYTVWWSATAAIDPNCDPSQTPFCERWLAGNYTARAEVCNGQCNSKKHPHTQIYDRARFPFNVTKQ